MWQLSTPESVHLLQGWRAAPCPEGTPALLASLTGLAFLAGSALTGSVWEPSRQVLFLQPGPALTRPGFVKPRVNAPVSMNRDGSQLQHRAWLDWQAKASHQSVRAVCPSS